MVIIERRDNWFEDDLLYALLRYSGKLVGVGVEGYSVDLSVRLCWCSFREMFLELGIDLRGGNILSFVDYLDGVVFRGLDISDVSHRKFLLGLKSLDRNKLSRVFDLVDDWRVDLDHSVLIDRGGIILGYMENIGIVDGVEVEVDSDVGVVHDLSDSVIGPDLGDIEGMFIGGDIGGDSVIDDVIDDIVLGVKGFDGIITDSIIDDIGTDRPRKRRGRPKGGDKGVDGVKGSKDGKGSNNGDKVVKRVIKRKK